jgi:hypothetical protein
LIINKKTIIGPDHKIKNITKILLKLNIPELNFSIIRNNKYINKEIILVKFTELEFGM